MSFAFTSGLEDHITLLAGSFPVVSPTGAENMVEVLINVALC